MIKKVVFALVIISLIVGGLAYIKLEQFGEMEAATAKMVFPPSTVTAHTVVHDEWEQSISATGTVSPVQGVLVSAETNGRVSNILFKSDDTAEKNQILVQLDTSTEDAQLASAQASAAQAKADLKRLKKLVAKKMVAADAVDQALTQVKETDAQVAVIKSTIDKKSIRAPFTGHLGIRQVNLGQIVSSGDPIVALQMLDPVYVDFSVPQQRLSQLKRNMSVRVTSDAAPDKTYEGKITAINLEVDAITRNVTVRALVDNPNKSLRTGMFVKIDVILPERLTVLPIPSSAISYATFGNSVFVIDETKDDSGKTDLVLRQQFVILGQARGDFVNVKDGLKPNETIVSTGVFKLQTGAHVIIDNALAPNPKLNPTPRDS